MPQFADEDAWLRLHRQGKARPLLDSARAEAQARLSHINEEMRNAGSREARNFLKGKRISTLHFLKLIELMTVKLKEWRIVDAVKAIEKHRFETRKAEITPEPHDLALWAVLGDENSPLGRKWSEK